MMNSRDEDTASVSMGEALRTRIMELEAQVERVFSECSGNARTVACAYCGVQFSEGTPRYQNETLTEHGRTCGKHPMRELEVKLAKSEANVEKLKSSIKRLSRLSGREGIGKIVRQVVDECSEIVFKHCCGSRTPNCPSYQHHHDDKCALGDAIIHEIRNRFNEVRLGGVDEDQVKRGPSSVVCDKCGSSLASEIVDQADGGQEAVYEVRVTPCERCLVDAGHDAEAEVERRRHFER